MPLTYTTTYTTRIDSTHMKAIIATQSKLLVTHVNGQEIHPPHLCEEMESHFLQTLNYATIALLGSPAESTINVLPSILYLQKAADKITAYTSDTHNTNLQKVRRFIQANDPNEPNRVCFRSLTKEQVFFMLNKLSQHLEFTGALHCHRLKQVIFQVNNKNFIIEYDRDNCHLKETFFCFNLDQGFIGEEPFIELLQPHFLRWKSNGYYGPVIPNTPSHFDMKEETCFDMIKSALYNMFFSPPSPSTTLNKPEKQNLDINISRNE